MVDKIISAKIIGNSLHMEIDTKDAPSSIEIRTKSGRVTYRVM